MGIPMNSLLILLVCLVLVKGSSIQYGPPRITVPPRDVKSVTRWEAVFVCEAEGNPRPFIHWERNSRQVSPRQYRYKISGGVGVSALSILPALWRDRGTFTCVASNGYGETRSQAKLIMHKKVRSLQKGHPMFSSVSKQRGVISVDKGKAVTLSCVTSGTPEPPPTIYWLKDGLPLDLERSLKRSRMAVSTNQKGASSLTMNNTIDEDYGLYQCLAENDKATAVSNGHLLKIKVPENTPATLEVEVSPKRQLIKPNGRATFVCHTKDLGPANFTWTTPDHKYIDTVWNRWNRYQLTERRFVSVLTIDPWREKKDDDTFICIAERNSREASARGTVAVHSENLPKGFPRLKVHPRETLVNVSDEAVMRCQAAGSPPLHYRWFKNQLPLDVSDTIYPHHRYNISDTGDLTITSVSSWDTGMYDCQVWNSEGSQVSRSAMLYVKEITSAPKITRAPKKQRVKEGMVVTFACEFTGIPAPILRWEMNGQEIHGYFQKEIKNKADMSTLSIYNVETSDNNTEISCSASNERGRDRASAWLTVYSKETAPDGYPVIITHPNIKAVEKGRSAVLTCQAEGTPKPVVTWTKDGFPLKNPRASVLDQGYLEIQDTQLTDQGKYACIAENEVGVVTSRRASLYIKERRIPPHFTLFPEDQTVERGSHSNLTCVAVGSPMPEVVWKDKQGRILENGSTLHLKNILTRATYTCSAENRLDRISKNVTVSVRKGEVAPELTSYPPDQTVEPGSGLNLTCTASGVPQPVITWSDDQGRAVGSGDTLHLKKIKKTTTYLCRAVNGLGSVTTDVTVTVENEREVAPELTSYPPDQTVEPGSDLNLICTASGLPQPVITWRDDQGRAVGSGDTLHLKKINRTTTYLCRAVNGLGSVTTGVTITVENEREVAPELISYPPDQTVESGSDMNLTCTASGVPQPVITWSDDQGRAVGSGDTLHLKKINKTTTYLCRAVNRLGSITTGVTVTVQRAFITPPTYLNIRVISATALVVSWEAEDFAMAGLEGYKVFYTQRSGRPISDWMVQKVVPTYNPKTVVSVISGLQTGTTYSVVVLGYTSSGDGPMSQIAEITTQEVGTSNKVPMMPYNLRTDIPSTSEIKIMWETPEDGDAIESYNVYFKASSSHQYTRITIMPPVPFYTLSGLSPDTVYQIQVSAGSRIGESPKTPIILARTKPSDVVDVSNTASVYAQVESNVTLACAEVAQSETAHAVLWLRNNALLANKRLGSRTMFTDDSIRAAILDDSSLLLYSVKEESTGNYTCKVFVKESEIDTFIEHNVTHSLIVQDFPDPPFDVQIKTCLATTATITWEYRDNQESIFPIVNFVVEYNTTFKSDTWMVGAEIPPDARQVQVRLSLWVVYSFRVKAVYRNGVGKASNITKHKCATPQAVPDRHPHNVTIVRDKPGYLVIEWEPMPLVEHNGPDFFYDISVQANDNGDVLKFEVRNFTVGRWEVVLPNDRLNKLHTVVVRSQNANGVAFGEPSPVTGYPGSPLPSPPRNLHVDLIQEDPLTVKVTWQRPREPRGPIENYKISWGRIGELYEEMILSPEKYSFMTYSLDKGTTYEFRVSAKNDVDYGERSVQNIKTPDGAPAGAPQNFTATGISETSVSLTWDLPARNLRNGDIIMYQIKYNKLDDPTGEESHNVTETFLDLIELEMNTDYLIKIRAFTSKGAGPWSRRLNFRTFGQLPSPPRNLHVDLIQEDPPTVKVTWQRPREPRGPIENYKISWGRICELYEEMILPSKRYSFVTHSLDKGTTYEFRVSAKNDVDYGERSVQNIKTPDGAPAGAPQNFTATGISETSVSLTWDLPARNLRNGDIIMYQIKYNMLDDPTGEESHNVTDMWLDLIELEMNTDYLIKIRAFTSKGAGPWSGRLNFRTFGQSPPAPRNVSVRRISRSSIRVTWDGPGTPVAGYKLYYNIFTTPIDTWTSVDIGPTTTADITGLEPHSVYAVRLQALSVDGRLGDLSSSVITPPFNEDIELKMPGHVTVTQTDGGDLLSVQVAWSPPDNMEVTSYNIFYTPDISLSLQDWMVERVPADSQYILLNLLKPESSYFFKIQALNDKIISEMSETVVFKPKPIFLEVRRLSCCQAELSWGDRSSKPTASYQLYYRETDEEENVTTVNTGPLRVTHIDGLQPDSGYQFKVRPRSTDGEFGLWTDWMDIGAYFNTSGDSELPQFNVRLRETPASLQYAYVVWSKLPNRARIKLTYLGEKTYWDEGDMKTVVVGEDEAWISRYFDSWNFFNLLPNTKYMFKMQRFDIHGSPSFTRVFNVMTAMREPSLVFAPAVLNRTKDSVVLGLNPTSQENGTFSHYNLHIECRNCKDDVKTYIAARLGARHLPSVFQLGDGANYGGFINRPLRNGSMYAARLEAVTVLPNKTKSSEDSQLFWFTGSLPPVRVRTTSVTIDAITIAWDGPDAVPYNLTINSTHGVTSTQEILKNKTFTFTNLIPETAYHIQVNPAIEMEGYSIKVWTNQLIPEQVQNVRVQILGINNINVWWKPLGGMYGGHIQGYQVRIQEAGANNKRVEGGYQKTINVNNMPYPYIYVDEIKTGSYRIRVAAVNNKGPGIFSTPRLFTIRNSGPSAPGRLRVERISDLSVNITWQLPFIINGVINEYRITWSQDGDVKGNTTVPSNTFDFTIESLNYGLDYVLNVTAKNGFGYGEPATEMLWTPEAAPSGPPLNARILQTDVGSTLVWDAPHPDLRNGRIESYVVVEEYLSNGEFPTSHVIRPKQFSETLGGNLSLSSFRKEVDFLLRVMATTDAGDGPLTSFLHYRTNDEVSEAPENVVARRISRSMIELTWDQPSVPVSGYRIQYMYWSDLQNDSLGTERVKYFETGPYTAVHLTGLEHERIFASVAARSTVGRYGNLSSQIAVDLFPGDDDSGVSNFTVSRRAAGLITLAWDNPKGQTVESYSISYQGQKSYWENGTMCEVTLDPVTQDINGSRTSYSLHNLPPSMLLEVTLTPRTAESSGGPQTLTLETNAEAPTFLRAPDYVENRGEYNLQIVLRLHPASEENGAIAYYHLYVVKEDYWTHNSQVHTDDVDVNLVFNNSGIYIAARFDYQSLPEEFVLGDSRSYGGFTNSYLSIDFKYRVFLRGYTVHPNVYKSSGYSDILSVPEYQIKYY